MIRTPDNHKSAPLVFPSPSGAGVEPVWDGTVFRIGSSTHSILSYEVGQSGWTDDLTTFHEETAGDDHYIDRASRNHALRSLQKWLPAGFSSIIDIGCSSGFMLSALRAAFPQCDIVGADYVLGPLEDLASNQPGIPLLQFDLTRCPLPDNSFDAVVILNVLEHIDRDDAALSHIARILKPNGIAVIEVPAGPHLYDVYDNLLHHHRRYRLSDLTAQVQRCGLIPLEKSHLGALLYPAFWMAKKRGRRYLKASRSTQEAVVARNIKRAKSNVAMHKLMELETALRRWIHYPAGIRCLLTCRKPAA